MQIYTVVVEAYDEEKSRRFNVEAESQEKAWTKAYERCADISSNSGVYWNPVDVVKKRC